MRSLVTTIVLSVAILAGFVFTLGTVSWGSDGASRELLEKLIAPFQYFSFTSTAIVLAGLTAFLVSLLLFETRDRGTRRRAHAKSWGHALGVAFFLNVLIAAGLIVLVVFFVRSVADPEPSTVGTIFGAIVLEIVIGTAVAVVLAFLPKKRLIYFTTLSVHVAEVLCVGAILFFGTLA